MAGVEEARKKHGGGHGHGHGRGGEGSGLDGGGTERTAECLGLGGAFPAYLSPPASCLLLLPTASYCFILLHTITASYFSILLHTPPHYSKLPTTTYIVIHFVTYDYYTCYLVLHSPEAYTNHSSYVLHPTRLASCSHLHAGPRRRPQLVRASNAEAPSYDLVAFSGLGSFAWIPSAAASRRSGCCPCPNPDNEIPIE